MKAEMEVMKRNAWSALEHAWVRDVMVNNNEVIVFEASTEAVERLNENDCRFSSELISLVQEDEMSPVFVGTVDLDYNEITVQPRTASEDLDTVNRHGWWIIWRPCIQVDTETIMVFAIDGALSINNTICIFNEAEYILTEEI